MDLGVATGLNKLPEHLRLQVKLWITDGAATPKLRSMLAERHSLLTPFLRGNAPRECWGSRHKVIEWSKLGGEHGRARITRATAELRAKYAAQMICSHQYHRSLRWVKAREGAITLLRQARIRMRLWRSQ